MSVYRAAQVLVFGFLLAAGCRHVPAPYPRGQAPSPERLLETTKPNLAAVAVPDARVVADRFARADLAFLAQAPDRFRATISKSGNELASLAFHEDGYTLRYKLDRFPTGFYSGPPSPCAVEALLGVPLTDETLVALVLGGGPLIAGASVVRQGWNDDDGVEELVVANDGFIEKLQFRYIVGRWHFAGAQLWEKTTVGERGRQLWQLEHRDFTDAGDVVMPRETQIRAPGERRTHRIVIRYNERDLDPAFARVQPTSPTTSPETTGEDPWGDDSGWEGAEQAGGWDDDSGWEGAEQADGWDDASGHDGAEEPANDRGPDDVGTGDASGVTGAGEAAPPMPAPERSPIPAVFQLEPTGLSLRGDLCR